MGMLDAVKSVMSKYVTFSGRATRSEYWWFFLFVMIISFITLIIDTMLFGYDMMQGGSFAPINTIASLALLLPNLSVSVRRLHDTGRSGWWLLVVIFVPIIGMPILWLVWFCARSEEGDNRFGPSPHGPAVTADVFA